MSKILDGIKYGLILGLLVILVWWLWAFMIYKWSADRLGNLILAKYQAIHQSKLTEDTFFDYSNVVLAADYGSCSATISLKNKATQVVLSSELVTYTITNDCTAIDLNCIGV